MKTFIIISGGETLGGRPKPLFEFEFANADPKLLASSYGLDIKAEMICVISGIVFAKIGDPIRFPLIYIKGCTMDQVRDNIFNGKPLKIKIFLSVQDALPIEPFLLKKKWADSDVDTFPADLLKGLATTDQILND